MNKPDRGPLLTVFALLFGLLPISDLAKPLEASLGGGLRPGFVLLGHRLSGAANAVVGPLFGLYLLVYAAGIWRMRRDRPRTRRRSPSTTARGGGGTCRPPSRTPGDGGASGAGARPAPETASAAHRGTRAARRSERAAPQP